MIIVDSSVWFEFERVPDSLIGMEMESLLVERAVVMVGPVMSEILQGSRSDREFEFYASRLDGLPYIETDQRTWTTVGELGRRLRRQGLSIAFADLIIAALAIQHALPLYTTDTDFCRIPEIEFYEPE